MLIVKITPAWFETCNVLLILLIFWWLCRICVSIKTLCDTDMCSCDHIGGVVCICIDKQGDLVIQRDGVQRLPPHTSALRVQDCASVHIKSKSFEELKSLSRINLVNIKNLTLEQHSFSWNDSTILETYPNNGIEITVENSSVSNLPTYVFRGRIEAITFNRVRFDVIHSYAFTSLAGTKTIFFRNCEFLLIENQAFKKFVVDKVFGIMGCHFASALPSRAFMDVGVRDEFLINDVSFERIRSSAFRVHGPRKFQLQNCRVSHIEGEAFMVHTRGPVFVDDNVFQFVETGAFLGFNVEKRELNLSGYQEFVFENNTIAEIERASLLFNINSFIPKLDWIFLNTKCECKVLPHWISDLIIYSHRYPEEKLAPNINVDEIVSCRNEQEYMRLKDYSRDYCGPRTQPLQMIAFVSLIAVLILLAVLLFYWVWYRNRKSRWINVPQSSPTRIPEPESVPMRVNRTNNSDPPSPCYEEPSTSRLTTMVRDGTGQYHKETEMNVIVECRESAIYANPFKERTHIYSNRCVELDRDYVNQRFANRRHLLTSDL